jgi:uncharacterized protein (DUF1330 family)
VIPKFGGKYIARGGAIFTLDGPEEERRVVPIEFSMKNDAYDAVYKIKKTFIR